ncbi:MAG: hypothetical protein COA54_04570 [Thiotrichaceae bacterium]|nr:MAG: hypothetical protein COA54_04570 [Thiotrichaceae bacterium]
MLSNKKFKFFTILTSLIAASLLTSCATLTEDITVDTKSDSTINYDTYKTYAWSENSQIIFDAIGQWEQPTLDTDEEVKFVINRELRAHGLRQVTDNPDLYVSFVAGVDTTILELKEDPNSNKKVLTNVPKAALVIALIDGKSGYTIWLGHAVGNVQPQQTIENIRKRIDYAVSEIFKTYNKKK